MIKGIHSWRFLQVIGVSRSIRRIGIRIDWNKDLYLLCSRKEVSSSLVSCRLVLFIGVMTKSCLQGFSAKKQKKVSLYLYYSYQDPASFSFFTNLISRSRSSTCSSFTSLLNYIYHSESPLLVGLNPLFRILELPIRISV